MPYEVTRYFTDAQDNEYAYREGDIYPREGHTVSEARLKDLLSGNNFQRVPLIKRVDKVSKPVQPKEPEKPDMQEGEEEGNVSWTADEINKMPFMKLKSVTKQNGIDVEDKKAAEIKEELIKKIVEE